MWRSLAGQKIKLLNIMNQLVVHMALPVVCVCVCVCACVRACVRVCGGALSRRLKKGFSVRNKVSEK